jgi:hypothetical protein
MSDEKKPMTDMSVDLGNLYKEESFTDLKVASIKQLTPITVDGERDESRPIIFIGQTQLMSQMGPVPVQCDIEAKNLEEALGKFPAAVQVAVEKMIEEAKEMQRQEASKIVIPGQEQMGKIIT